MIVAMTLTGIIGSQNPEAIVIHFARWDITTSALETILFSLGLGAGIMAVPYLRAWWRQRQEIKRYRAELQALREHSRQLLLALENSRSEVTLLTNRLARLEEQYYLEHRPPVAALEADPSSPSEESDAEPSVEDKTPRTEKSSHPKSQI